jgi:hypothetical protein
MASIVVEQKIFAEWRDWLKTCTVENPNWFMKKTCALISCMFCTGAWCGFILSFTVLNFVESGSWWQDMFICGLVGAFFTYVIHLGMGYVQNKLEALGIDT